MTDKTMKKIRNCLLCKHYRIDSWCTCEYCEDETLDEFILSKQGEKLIRNIERIIGEEEIDE